MSDTEPGARLAETFGELYDRERQPMLRVAYLIVGAVEPAEDLVHDSFVELHRRWHRIGNHGAYLRRTVINRCLSWQRRRRLEQSHLERLQRDGAAHGVQAPDAPLWMLLQAMPVRTRTALVLTYYLDLTSEEAAEYVGCRPGTIRSLVHRGIEALRKEVR